MKNKNRSIMVDFGDENQYQNIISEGKIFIEFVMAYVMSLGFQLIHKSNCSGGNCFTRHSHYARVKSGNVTIWRIQCKRCKAVFTVIPSFLMRYFRCRTEQVKKALIAYHGGLSFENCAICFNISGLCLYRFICALGKYSIPTILCKSGISLPKNMQADEKHSKCLGNKGYIPILSSGHVIWHIDYVENVDEQTLEASYRKYSDEAKIIDSNYAPKTITHDGFQSTINALSNIFKKATVYLICWIHSCQSLGKLLRPFSREQGDKISWKLWEMLKESHKKASLKRISLRSRFTALQRKYREILPDNMFHKLKTWIARRKPYFYASMDYALSFCFSYSIDHICNHLDRKLFNMKHFHHPRARKDLFLKGFALIHNFIPYQRFARNAHKCPAEVEGATLPHSDWFLSLLIFLSEGYHKIE